MTQPDFIASLKQVERDLAASAKLARASAERIRQIKAKAEAPSPKRSRKNTASKASTVKPTFQPTQKRNPISLSGHQGADRESLATAPKGTKNDQ